MLSYMRINMTKYIVICFLEKLIKDKMRQIETICYRSDSRKETLKAGTWNTLSNLVRLQNGNGLFFTELGEWKSM